MPIGPNGEKRPQAAIANAVLSMRIATGQADETIVKVLAHESTVGPAVERSAIQIPTSTRLAAVARWGPRPTEDIALSGA